MPLQSHQDENCELQKVLQGRCHEMAFPSTQYLRLADLYRCVCQCLLLSAACTKSCAIVSSASVYCYQNLDSLSSFKSLKHALEWSPTQMITSNVVGVLGVKAEGFQTLVRPCRPLHSMLLSSSANRIFCLGAFSVPSALLRACCPAL